MMKNFLCIFVSVCVSMYVVHASGGQHSIGNVGCPGCQQGIDFTDPEVVGAMKFAVDTVNAQAKTNYRYMPVRLYNATSQVVAGSMYRVTFDLGMTFCTNTNLTMSNMNVNCPLQPGQQTYTCRVAVWDEPWRTPRYVLSEDQCTSMLTAIGK